MKQTGVEYLVEQLFPKALSEEQYYHIEQAKEMEKEQITEAHTFGYVIGGGKADLYNPEQYYNETFKSE
jgi:GMP synthase-like glutamine amidotransferase